VLTPGEAETFFAVMPRMGKVIELVENRPVKALTK
jgi:hypothetical protein